ncbi:MAG: peptide deformylase [Candidatus Saccharimonadales bacterium]
MKERLTNPKEFELKLVSPNTEVLNQVSEEISPEAISHKATQELIDAMLRVANGEQGDKKRRTMVGLSAPQVGISKRVIVVDTASTGMGETPVLKAYVNPAIVSMSEQTEAGREGCFSTGNVCGNVDRSSEVTIEAYDRQGNQVTETWTGFTARIFQHEIDHLDGVRFPDRITDDAKLHWVEPDKFGEYRTEWANWDVLCSRSTWDGIKSGVKI